MNDYAAVRLLVARHKEIIWQGRNMPPNDLPGALAKVTDERLQAFIAVSERFGHRAGRDFLQMYETEMRDWVTATECGNAAVPKKASGLLWSIVLVSLFTIGFAVPVLSR